MLGQLARFGSIGAIATLVHVVAALAVQSLFGMTEQHANLGGFFAAVLVSYLGHLRYTFQLNSHNALQMLRFFALSCVALATSSAIVWLVTDWGGFSFLAAMALVAVVVPPVSYVAMRFWVFDGNAARAEVPLQGLAISAAVALSVLAVYWGRPVTDDVAWYLIATREWLGGAPLYEMIYEVNPPLNFYFTVPAVLLADLFGLSDTNGQYLAFSLLLFGILVWCSNIIRADFGLSPQYQGLLLVGVAVALILPRLDSLAQREQTLVILMMPWLLGQVRPQGKHEISRAAVAALGVCLKPHFVLFPLAITVWRAVQTRSLRPVLSSANLTFLIVGLAYVGYVAIVHPAYIYEVAPAAQLVYAAYRAEPTVLLGTVYPHVALLLLPVLFLLLDKRAHADPGPFAALSLAGLVVFVLQGTGFGYHTIPLVAFGLMACFMTLVNTRRAGTFLIAVAAAVTGLMVLSIRQGFPRNEAVTEVSRMANVLGEFQSIMVLSTSPFSGPAVAYGTGAKWASRYPANWLVPGAVNRLSVMDCSVEAETCQKLEALAARNRADNIADIALHRPDVLIIERFSLFFEPRGFDWQGFMAGDPGWAPVFEQYEQVATTDWYFYFRRK